MQVLSHLPLHKALPAHVSAIMQSVNKLRFYRTPGACFYLFVVISPFLSVKVINFYLNEEDGKVFIVGFSLELEVG